LASNETAGTLTVSYAGQTLLLYKFEANQFKPYVKELRTLAGHNVLLDSPPDHPHHHGLMYAVRLNDINFWEEQMPCGRQQHLRFLHQKADGLTAQFTEILNWIAPTGVFTASQQTLLVEERKLLLTIRPESNEVALRWTSNFTVGREKVRLQGTAYNGLGMRFPQAWNGKAIHFNSASLPHSQEHKWDVTTADWSAVTYQGMESTNTIAFLSSFKNRGDSKFFSMNNPFTYLAATQGLDIVPLEYGPAEKFNLEYLLLAYSVAQDAKQLDHQYTQWQMRGFP
jgi:hypothetical protein